MSFRLTPISHEALAPRPSVSPARKLQISNISIRFQYAILL